MENPPVKLATVPFDVLQSQQWEPAKLLLDAGTRPLSIDEIRTQVHKLSAVIASAAVTWQEPAPATPA